MIENKAEIKVLTLEITNYCNLSCWMCPHNSMTRPIGFMDIELVKKLSPQIAELNLDFICLHGIGESLLHPKLREILTILRSDSPKLIMGLATNGTFLTRKNFDKIEGLVDEVSIAVDGINQEQYSTHRIGGNLQQVINYIEDIMEYRRELKSVKPYIAVQMIKLGQSLDDRNEFVNFWKTKILSQDKVRFIEKASFGGQVPIDFRIDRCAALFAQISILWNGILTTCCWDSDGKNSIGNVNTDKIKDIWESEQYQKMRQLHDSGELQKGTHRLCHTCLKEDYSKTIAWGKVAS